MSAKNRRTAQGHLTNELYEAFEQGKVVEVWHVSDGDWVEAYLVEANTSPGPQNAGLVAQTTDGRTLQVPLDWVRIP